jgi:phage FluMu gp28-like protein
MLAPDTYFYASQRAWIQDDSLLKICVKSRQTGFSFANAFRLVILVNAQDARLDAHIISRDQYQARLQAEDCLHWARILNLGARDLGEILLDANSGLSAYALQFANGRRIYSLSSNPNALAGKRGHVTLDEFALHPDQRLLYRVAKPVTTWGGQ